MPHPNSQMFTKALTLQLRNIKQEIFYFIKTKVHVKILDQYSINIGSKTQNSSIQIKH